MEEGYLTVEETATKWGISKRRVQKLCTEGRIPSVRRFGRSWAIPRNAQKLLDGRNRLDSNGYIIK